MTTRLVIVGDALLDRDLEGRVERLSPDAPVPIVDEPEDRPRPGGAGLAAILAATSAHQVTLVSALSEDEAGRQLCRLLTGAGVMLVNLGSTSATPEKIRVRADGRTLLRLDRGGRRPGQPGKAGPEAMRALATANAVLVSDYGWGVSSDAALRSGLQELARTRPVVWDPHPQGAPVVPGMRLVTPNRHEAGAGEDLWAVERRARELRDRWHAAGVAVTLGAGGALLVAGRHAPLVAPAPAVAALDVCGAGDSFAVAATRLLAGGSPLEEAVAGAVAAASAFVAGGGAAAAWRSSRAPARVHGGVGMESALAVISATRARGGRVVATGGCFDLLHAGHVSTLSAARRLGDCLVVCLNSDASVRRLKGAGRPLVSEEDRLAVLMALEAVDAVVLFDEDTPEAVLQRLRPEIWAKGGDYQVAELPEQRLLDTWGAKAVILPYLDGRSSTGLFEEASRRAGR